MSEYRSDSLTGERSASLLQQSNLTTSQLYIWMGQQLNPTLPLYNMALSFTIDEALDADRFQRAFAHVLKHSDALRTIFRVEDGVPQQQVANPNGDTLPYLDFSGGSDPIQEASDWCRAHARHLFDLEEGLYESALLKVGEQKYVWFLNQHHLITDAWSTAVLYHRMADTYRQMESPSLEAVTEWPQFSAYIAHERTLRDTERADKARAYWREKGERVTEALHFYGHHGPTGSAQTTRVHCPLGKDRAVRLRKLAEAPEFRTISRDLSLFNLVCTILFAWLHRVCGSNDVAFLTPSHNRSKPEFREMAGLFIEIFPLHATLAMDETFDSLAGKVRAETFAFLQFAVAGASSNEANRKNTVLLNFINRSFGPFGGSPMRSEWVHPEHGDATHSLRIQVHDFDDTGELIVHFDFHRDVFGARERTWAIDHFLRMVDGCLDDPGQKISDVSLLSSADRDALGAFNPPIETTPSYPSVLQQFRTRVKEYPSDTIAICRDVSISYEELDTRSNQLAHHLIAQHTARGATIAILMERSIELIVALLGVLKAGAAYVPLDPQNPPSRINQIIETSGIETILSMTPLRSKLPDGKLQILCLDTLRDTLSRWPVDASDHEPGMNDLAYVLYTSGSTGAPKGVMISHGALANYVSWAATQYTRGERCSFALFTSPAFDLTITSIYVPLITGGKIIIYGNSEHTGDLSVLDVIENNGAEILKLTPSHLALLLNIETDRPSVKRMILGGEDLKATLAGAAVAKFGPALEIYNEYGPTEATVGCMIHRYDPNRERAGSVSLGRPAANTHIYLLDAHHRSTPPGVVGELYIAGAGIALGYLNRPDLTAEAFVPNPFLPGTRMYKTGDLGRWRSDSELEFLGRVDEQVKVRGARVELAEVEAALLDFDGVTGCAVTLADPSPRSSTPPEVVHCSLCGLPSNVPGAAIGEDNLCNVCREYKGYRRESEAYFGTLDDLRGIFKERLAAPTGDYDCMMLLSGGKDSTYALGKLKEMGLRVLAFSLDNGYISEEAKTNVRKVVEALGVDLVFATTPAMNAVFVDSLQRYSNVCNGCFKVIYTLAMEHAHKHGIRHIVTGLSRGQIFDTRLKEFFRHGTFDPREIDRQIIQARKAYHRAKDAVSRHMDVSLTENDQVFDEIAYVDFYRYCDVDLDDVYHFLADKVPWVRPSDTGRSTNCLINEVGIFVHKRDRGYHNYASPYSWDVRLGHKTRDAAMDELDDDIDEASVQSILDEIGYTRDESHHGSDKRLTAYYVGGEAVTAPNLRAYLTQRLPAYMLPQAFIQLDRIPLTTNGKVDRDALPAAAESRSEVATPYVAPRNSVERILAGIWEDVLDLDRVGVNDNFIALGGDSILNIQSIARAYDAGLKLSPRQLFDHPTVAELAEVAEPVVAEIQNVGPLTGVLPLSPIQHWLFDQALASPNAWNHEIRFVLPRNIHPDSLDKALTSVIRHHDALGLSFHSADGQWTQHAGNGSTEAALRFIALGEFDVANQKARLDTIAAELHSSINIEVGAMLRGALVRFGAATETHLILTVHHLAMDALSWETLISDLEAAYHQIREKGTAALPPARATLQDWSKLLQDTATRRALPGQVNYWVDQAGHGATCIPRDFDGASNNRVGDARTLRVELSEPRSADLLGKANQAFGTHADELLYAALGNALCAWMGAPAALIDTERHGRDALPTDHDWTRTIGWFTTLFPILLTASDPNDIGAPLVAAKDRLRGLPDGGAAYGILRYVCGDTEIRERLADLPPREVLFNYLGQFDRLLADHPLCRPATPLHLHRDGANPRPHLLAVNAMVLDGRLRVDWEFNPAIHRRETVEKVAESFLKSLEALIAHCMSRDDTTRTSSDFPLAQLDSTQFQKLSKALGKTKPTTDGR